MVLRRDPIPAPLRRAANRAAGPRGRSPSPKLQSAAESGVLTRRNTKKGSAGRKAVDQAVYRRRVAFRPEGVTARARAGHEASATRQATAMSTILVGRGFVLLEGLSYGERRRVARYDSLLGQLAAGDLSPATFRRRVRSWAPVRGERFEYDPAVALAILDERREAGDEVFIYRGRR